MYKNPTDTSRKQTHALLLMTGDRSEVREGSREEKNGAKRFDLSLPPKNDSAFGTISVGGSRRKSLLAFD